MSRAVCRLAAAFLLISLPPLDAQTVPPRHLHILEAVVAEGSSPRFHGEPASRPIFFRWRLAAKPECSARRPGASYSFLIDSDRNARTGRRVTGFDELGLEARVTAACDPRAAVFTSALGDVQGLALASGEYVLELTTTLGKLPASSFRWIALSRDGGASGRYPQTGRAGTWSVVEQARW